MIFSKTTTFQSRILHYRTGGTGKAIILIHGFGETNEIWNNQLQCLMPYYKVITPDLPGSGKSDALPTGHTIEDLAHCIHKIIETEQIENPLILGHSMGGYVTLAYLKLYNSAVIAAGLIHSTVFDDNEAKRAARLKSISFIKDNGSYCFLKTSIPGLFFNSNNPEINNLIQLGEQFSVEVLINYYNAMLNRLDSRGIVEKLEKPFLLIAGEHDQAVQYQETLRQSYLANQTWFYTLRSSAHMGMIEESESVNKILYRFANSVFES